jgi:hypothetical protein
MSLSLRASLALVICFPVLSWAQQSPAPPTAPAETQKTEGRIHLDVVVTDKSGKPVTGLTLKDFTLLDNSQPAKILSFHAFDGTAQNDEPPTEVILLLDAVNIPIQALFILSSQGLDLQRQPLLDGNQLADEASQRDNKLRALTASAGMHGEVENYQFSVRMMKVIAREEAKKPGRKLLIWTGFGWPLVDSSFWGMTTEDLQTLFNTIAQLSTQLREARISVYNVSSGTDMASAAYEGFLKGVNTYKKSNSANLALKVLVVQTGGAIYGPDNNMAAQINRCVQDAGTYYTLSFDPPQAAQANEYHDLKVTVGQPKLIVRTSTGYYNQP